MNFTADSLIWPNVSKAISWKMYEPDNVAYLACFLDAAISAAAPAEDAEAEMYEPASVVATNIPCEGQSSFQGIKRQTVRVFTETSSDHRYVVTGILAEANAREMMSLRA